MSRANLSSQSCNIARAVALVGDEWTLMILREMFLGSRRFDDFQRLTGVSPHLLSVRLKKLEVEGVVMRSQYCSHPPRHEYRLTDKGRDLWPVIISIKQWGDRWLGDDGTMSVEIVHKSCGCTVQPQITCPDCGDVMGPHDADAVLSPSFERQRNTFKRRA